MKLLLIDDHRLILNGIRGALAFHPEFEIVGEAMTGERGLALAETLEPDIVVLDIRMPDMDGLECLALLRRRHPSIKVVVLSVYDDVEHIHAALSRGAAAYVVKTVNPSDLAAALTQAVEGTVFHALGPVEHESTRSARDYGLTEREFAILRSVARGMSNRAIGLELFVTEQTVKFHLTNLYRKLEVANRTEAAHVAYRLGISETSPVVETV